MTTPPAELDEIFDLLSHPLRRRVLDALDPNAGPLSVSELVASVTADDADTSNRTRIALEHAHLPRLRDGGLIDYDPERATVSFPRTGGELSWTVFRDGDLLASSTTPRHGNTA